ncbi:hypothetical protein EKH55_4433 [Sinorhizobium alkalisoli]|nr:hypothetical protein EKH55_4433 [Sinorhizobium alkalisoli]
MSPRRQTTCRGFSKALQSGIAIGATNIRIWSGTRGRDSEDYSAAERRATADAIRKMRAEAARHRIGVSLEYHPQSLTDTTQSARRLIEAIAHENVYLYWQPRPRLPLEEALAEIGEIGPHVSHVHVFAWDRDRNRFPLASAGQLSPPCPPRAGTADALRCWNSLRMTTRQRFSKMP